MHPLWHLIPTAVCGAMLMAAIADVAGAIGSNTWAETAAGRLRELILIGLFGAGLLVSLITVLAWAIGVPA